MRVQDIKFYNLNHTEVTNLLVINTDYVKEFLTKKIHDCLNYEQLCRIFDEVKSTFLKDVVFNRIEFDFSNNILNVFYTFNSKPINLKVFLK